MDETLAEHLRKVFHDLRSPLSSISLRAASLRGSPSQEQRERAVEAIRASVREISQILEHEETLLGTDEPQDPTPNPGENETGSASDDSSR